MYRKIQFNFGGYPEIEGFEKKYSEYKNSKIVILPIPFDATSTWIKGSDKGPKAIIEASPHLEFYDIETGSEVYKNGIFTEKEIISDNSEDMVKKAEESVSRFLEEGKFVVTLGGDHSVSNGPIKAYAKKFKNLSILHLDAHSDRRDSYHGSKLSHASIMARAEELTHNVVSVGIRSIEASEIKIFDKKKIFFAKDIQDNDLWMEKAIKELSDTVYISIDADAFDPSIIPATGTPEPGGLQWYQTLKLLKKVAKEKNIVGFDFVELCPLENNKVSDFVAAKLIYQLLSYTFAFRK